MPARPPVDVIGGRKGWSAGRAFNCLTEAFCLWRRQARQSSLGGLLPARTSIQAPSCPSGPGRMGRANEPVRIGSAQQLGSRTTPAARHSSAWAAASWASWRHHLRAPTGRRSRHGRPRGMRPPARPISEHSRVLIAMHKAMRTDSQRLIRAVDAPPAGDTHQAAALGRAFGAIVGLIHDHHWTEDDVMYPFLLERVPTFESDAIRLEDDHEAGVEERPEGDGSSSPPTDDHLLEHRRGARPQSASGFSRHRSRADRADVRVLSCAFGG